MTIRLLLQAVLGVALASACGPSVIVMSRARQSVLIEEAVPAPSAGDPRAGEPGAGPKREADAQVDEYVAPETAQDDTAEGEDADPAALQRFRTDLDQYGQWIEDARYGTVWVPYSNVVGVNFRPYVSGGYWSTTVEDRWLWVSDYPFGGVVFHYGRWVWLPGEGWAWVAGNRYSPAWVQFWVADGGYIGWAPLAPVHIWRSGVVVWIVAPPPHAHVFVPRRHVYSRRVSDHVVSNTTHAQQLQRKARLEPRLPTYERAAPAAPRQTAAAAASGETRQRSPYKTFSSKPGRNTDPKVRTSFAGPKLSNKVQHEQRPAASAKPAKTVPRGLTKPEKRTPALQSKRRAADGVVIAPIVKSPQQRSARGDAPPRAKKPAPERKAHPPMPRVRKIPQQMKLPPRRIAPPPRGRHTTPSARRRH